MSLSDYQKNYLAQQDFSTSPPGQSAQYWIGVTDEAILSSDTGTTIASKEIAGCSRVAYNPGATRWDVSNGIITNLQTIEIGPSSVATTVTHGFIATSNSGGNIKYFWELDTPKVIGIGTTFAFAPAGISLEYGVCD